jgi:hypothetical protein
MANRSGKRFHDHHYRWLARTDGEYCLICKIEGTTRAPPEWPLEIDHARTDLVDGDPEYWNPPDTALLCKTCNLSLRYKSVEEHRAIIHHYRARNERASARERAGGRGGASAYPNAPTIMDAVDFSQGSPEMQVKSHYEPLFERFVFDRITEYHSYPFNSLLDEFFNDTKASQLTTRRYLNGYCSATGLYRNKKIKGVWTITFKYPPQEAKKCLTKTNRPAPDTSAAAASSGSAPAGEGPNGSAVDATPPRRTALSTGRHEVEERKPE